VAGDDWRGDHVHIPFQVTIFHAGTSGNSTAVTAAGTAELATVPMARSLVDLSSARQMRLICGQKVLGAGGTSQYLQLQYSTDQTTWAAAHASGNGIDLRTGTANTVHDAGWVNLVAGAQVDNCFLRLVLVTTGTMTTGATISWADALFK
jgi:hypothetical protein